MATHILKVIAGGRVTLPKEVRKKENLVEGDFVEIQVVRKIKPTKESA